MLGCKKKKSLPQGPVPDRSLATLIITIISSSSSIFHHHRRHEHRHTPSDSSPHGAHFRQAAIHRQGHPFVGHGDAVAVGVDGCSRAGY